LGIKEIRTENLEKMASHPLSEPGNANCPKQPDSSEGAVPKTDGLCIVNGALAYNFWRSPDPWEEAKELATIECEYCHGRVVSENIELDVGIKSSGGEEHSCQELLAKFICEDCFRVERTKNA
jgi:hypothetical protein